MLTFLLAQFTAMIQVISSDTMSALLKNLRIHDLRHSFASFLVNSGCSLYEVQKILGHYDPKVTMRYAHLAQSSLVKAANMVEKSINLYIE